MPTKGSTRTAPAYPVFARTLFAACLVALLSGCAAALVGGAAVGAAAVSDRRSLGNQIDDQTIERAMQQRIKAQRDGLPGARVKAVAHNGTLLLIGETHDAAQRDRIAGLAADLPGVRRVVTELAVTEPAGVLRRSRDTLLTTRAKAALVNLGVEGFDATKVNVTAVRAEVYLMGLVTRREGAAAVSAISELRGVRRIVKVFEYLD
jgi:osmotically-inducible protein OsmY